MPTLQMRNYVADMVSRPREDEGLVLGHLRCGYRASGHILNCGEEVPPGTHINEQVTSVDS